jgi:hypothetical protein
MSEDKHHISPYVFTQVGYRKSLNTLEDVHSYVNECLTKERASFETVLQGIRANLIEVARQLKTHNIYSAGMNTLRLVFNIKDEEL